MRYKVHVENEGMVKDWVTEGDSASDVLRDVKTEIILSGDGDDQGAISIRLISVTNMEDPSDREVCRLFKAIGL